MAELEEFLARRGLQFFLVDCAVVIRIGSLKFFGDDRLVLFAI